MKTIKITIPKIRRAVQQAIARLFPDTVIWRHTVREPVTRPAFRVAVQAAGCAVQCDGGRERTAEIIIWAYTEPDAGPDSDMDAVLEALLDTFSNGIQIENFWIYPDDAVAFSEEPDDVGLCQMMITWYETAAETGEMMEELNTNITVENMEVLANGTRNADCGDYIPAEGHVPDSPQRTRIRHSDYSGQHRRRNRRGNRGGRRGRTRNRNRT